MVGLTGLIGSGYSDVIYMIFGASRADAGTIAIDGAAAPLVQMSPRRAIAMGCILIPGDRLASGAVATLSVNENVNQPVLSQNQLEFGRFRMARSRATPPSSPAASM